MAKEQTQQPEQPQDAQPVEAMSIERQIWEDKKSGLTVMALAEKYGLNKNTITKKAKAGAEEAGEPYEDKKAKGKPQPRDIKPGVKNAPTPKDKSKEASAALIGGFLQTIHKGMALALNAPALEISDDEAQMIAGPLSEIIAQYNILKNEKLIMWSNLAVAVMMVEGSRLGMIAQAAKANRKKKAKPQLEVVEGNASKPAENVDKPKPIERGEPLITGVQNAPHIN